MASLTGANRDYVLNHIPHISRIMQASIDAVLAHAEVVVVGNAAAEFRDALARVRPGVEVIDFVRVTERKSRAGEYDGICW
jgi:GDP-mannose 6-dehydrogenase